MKKGDIVTIYEDPITNKKEEGKARLIKKHRDGSCSGDREFWEVKFEPDPHSYFRWIKPR